MAVSGTSSIDVAGIASQLMTIELDERLEARLDALAGGELAERLRTLHDFCVMEPLHANVRNTARRAARWGGCSASCAMPGRRSARRETARPHARCMPRRRCVPSPLPPEVCARAW
jgi:hypothetical protein